MVRTVIRKEFVQECAMSSSSSVSRTGGETIGHWLNARRNALGLRREELTTEVGYSSETIYKVETGTRRPSRQIAEICARFFNNPSDEREAFISFARGQGPTAEGQRPGDREHPWQASQHKHTNVPAQLTSLIGRE